MESIWLASCLRKDASSCGIWKRAKLLRNILSPDGAISRDGTTAVGHPSGTLQQGLRELDLLLAGKIQLGQVHGAIDCV